jgi:hypothetical protein
MVGALAPRLSELVMSESFSMFPESAAAGGSGGEERASPDMLAFAKLIRGVHW